MKIPFIMLNNKNISLRKKLRGCKQEKLNVKSLDEREYKLRNRRGFTLIEMLTAIAVISFTVLPITTGLLNSVKSAAYAREVYKATLCANNLILDIEAILRRGQLFDYERDGLEDLIKDFSMNYETDIYDYMIAIEGVGNGSPKRLELKSSGAPESDAAGIAVDGIIRQLSASHSPANEVIEWDGELSIAEGRYSTFNEYSAIIEIPELEESDTIVDFNLRAPGGTSVVLSNDSSGSAFMRIFYDGEYPADLRIGFAGTGTVPIVGFYQGKSNAVYILFAEVWDKKGRSLICKAKPVII